MVSTKLLGVGTILFFIGVLGMGIHMFGLFQHMTVFTVASIMAGLGAFLIILSILSLSVGAVGDTIGDFKGMHAGDSNVFSVGLLRCMLAITIADEHIDDTEIDQLQKVFKHLTGTPIDEEIIRYTAEEMMANDTKTDIAKELKYVIPVLNNTLKKNMIIASLYILAADGDMDEDELLMLDEIREALRISIGACEKIKKEFFENYANQLKT